MTDRPVTPAKKAEMQRALRGLDQRTIEAYKSLAAHFYATRLPGVPPSPKRIADALKAAAPEYRPAYWRKLRNALMYDQISKGFYEAAERVKETVNPVTQAESKTPVKPKQLRIKGINAADYEKLKTALERKGDAALAAAVSIAALTGCRPAEMLGIERRGANQIFIPGAKQSKEMKRGLDRLLTIPENQCEYIANAVALLRQEEPGESGVVHKLQSRLDRLTRQLWPRRKARITLYSFRHQLGSDLKASGMDRAAVAYIMGHQSTQSVEVYGDKRKAAWGRNIKPGPGVNSAQIVRVNHEEPGPKAQVRRGPERGYSL